MVSWTPIPVVDRRCVRRGHISELFVSFQGEGLHAGRRHLFIRFAGCNLRCRYCDTPGSLERVERFQVHRANEAALHGDNPVSVDRLIEIALDLVGQMPPIDGISLTGGEPLLQSDFVAEFLHRARFPHPTLLETNGMLPERLAVVLPHLDWVSMDIKLASNTGEPNFWDEHEKFLTLARGKVYVKILVDEETIDEEIARAGRLVASCAPDTPVFIQPITGPDGRVRMSGHKLSASFEELKRDLADVRVLPQTHKMLGIL